MSNPSRIEIKGWQSASEVVGNLVRAGYQVLVETDNEHRDLPLDKIAFIISYTYPSWDGCEFIYYDPAENETDK